jgi:hypothetical protein
MGMSERFLANLARVTSWSFGGGQLVFCDEARGELIRLQQTTTAKESTMEFIHTCYRITDPEKSTAFYEALGFEKRRELPIREEDPGSGLLRSTCVAPSLLVTGP